MYGKRSSGKQEYALLKYPILLFVEEIYSQIPYVLLMFASW